jgi:hypothetical protein
MGLLRGVARTAVVAGTATAVSNRVSRRQDARYQQQADAEAYRAGEQAAAAAPAPVQYAPAPAPAAPPVDDTTAQLQQLAALQQQGILTAEEFAAKKKQILGI